MDKIPQSIIDLLNSLSCETVAERLNLEVVKHKTLCFMHDDRTSSESIFLRLKQREVEMFCMQQRWWSNQFGYGIFGMRICGGLSMVGRTV